MTLDTTHFCGTGGLPLDRIYAMRPRDVPVGALAGYVRVNRELVPAYWVNDFGVSVTIMEPAIKAEDAA